MSALERFLGATTDTSSALDLPLFRGEVIRYRASWLPSKRADCVFLRNPVLPNKPLQPTPYSVRSVRREAAWKNVVTPSGIQVPDEPLERSVVEHSTA